MISRFLNKIFTVKRPTETESIGGATKLTDVDHLTINGAINGLSGSEIIANEQRGVISSHKFYCLYCDIKQGDKVLHGSDEFIVQFVKDPMGMGEFLQIDLLENTTKKI
jgi:head-tail adaptor